MKDEELAREIADDTFSEKHVPEMHGRLMRRITTALRSARLDALEEAAKIAERENDAFPYAPHITEEQRVKAIVNAIRRAAGTMPGGSVATIRNQEREA